MITKYTAQYSDGTSADFMTLEDLITHDQHPELHPDVGVTQNAPVSEVPAEEAAETPEEEKVEDTPEK